MQDTQPGIWAYFLSKASVAASLLCRALYVPQVFDTAADGVFATRSTKSVSPNMHSHG
jgi:hypothetical protein